MSQITVSATRNHIDHKHQRILKESFTSIEHTDAQEPLNTCKTDLFSEVIRDNSQLLILSTVNWIFQVPQTSLTGKPRKPGTRDCRRNPALVAVCGNSLPASHGNVISPFHVSCRDFYQLVISGLPFQRLSYMSYPRTFIKLGRDSEQAMETSASVKCLFIPTAFTCCIS